MSMPPTVARAWDIAVLAALAGVFFAGGSPGWAGSRSEATARVRIRVDAIVALEARETYPGSAAPGGDVVVDLSFHLTANVDRVWFQAFVSDLFKAGDPRNVFFVRHAGGVLLDVSGASPLWGSSQYLRYVPGGSPSTVDGYPAYPTETQGWESSRLASFASDILATFTWGPADPTLPPGQYEGVVKLVAYSLRP